MPTFTLVYAPSFHFWPTVTSHGWCVLSPFSYDDEGQTLARVDQLASSRVLRWQVRSGDGSSLQIETDEAVTSAEQDEIRVRVARILSMDQDLTAFYSTAAAQPGYDWIEARGAGRMLTSPSVWEDLAKTLLTTNTTWTMTRGMVTRLTELGDRAADGTPSFPRPEQVAALTPDALNDQVRAGYRGVYLHTLADQIASGAIDPERWRDTALDSAQVYKELKQLKGFGPYAIGALMRLLGRFDELGLDSVCRTMFKTRFNNGEPATDKQIAAYYAPFGRWRGLAVWMDVIWEEN
jgi:3-methyladenine DNA glycosylase/8-oxoguanine DNA glycosylase